MLKHLKNWIIHWIWFLLVVWLVWVSYAAFTILPRETSNQPLTADKWNAVIDRLNSIDEKQIPNTMAVFSADSTSPVDIRDSLNISSIVRNSTWVFTLTFSEPMNNLNYYVIASVVWEWRIVDYNFKWLSSVQLRVRMEDWTFVNQPEISVVIFWWK